MKIEGSSPLVIRINVKLQRIEKELRGIDRKRRALEGLNDIDAMSDIKTSMTAFAVHNVYNGIEQILEDIARDIDGGLPGGNNSHGDLLDQLCIDTEHRPAIISESILEPTRDLMKFRHFFRHSYGVEFRKSDIEEKYQTLKDQVLPELLASLQQMSSHIDSPAEITRPRSRLNDGP